MRIPASTGPSTIVDHSSALKSLLVATVAPLVCGGSAIPACAGANPRWRSSRTCEHARAAPSPQGALVAAVREDLDPFEGAEGDDTPPAAIRPRRVASLEVHIVTPHAMAPLIRI